MSNQARDTLVLSGGGGEVKTLHEKKKERKWLKSL
jgi:hypothetical protein